MCFIPQRQPKCLFLEPAASWMEISKRTTNLRSSDRPDIILPPVPDGSGRMGRTRRRRTGDSHPQSIIPTEHPSSPPHRFSEPIRHTSASPVDSQPFLKTITQLTRPPTRKKRKQKTATHSGSSRHSHPSSVSISFPHPPPRPSEEDQNFFENLSSFQTNHIHLRNPHNTIVTNPPPSQPNVVTNKDLLNDIAQLRRLLLYKQNETANTNCHAIRASQRVSQNTDQFGNMSASDILNTFVEQAEISERLNRKPRWMTSCSI
ncbi:hypothetical protein BLNAU_6434 [Blattamonas nauphoetae]|uniref:Uncharacterized protein n=1 Tax=Blattamonas nauphoetae TaxID=2049346 RepID=A0ABQ9Y4K1_9EUKA|nr:hypothetical protein BLNAU_6434 [Blattamonas nauphoetae]